MDDEFCIKIVLKVRRLSLMRCNLNLFADIHVESISENNTEFKRFTAHGEDPSLRELNIHLPLNSHVLLLYVL